MVLRGLPEHPEDSGVAAGLVSNKKTKKKNGQWQEGIAGQIREWLCSGAVGWWAFRKEHAKLFATRKAAGYGKN